MDDVQGIPLPKSGLAEDILSLFVEQAQREVDRGAELPAGHEAHDVHHLVTFKLGSEEYGVEIGNVQEIIRAANITNVPGAPPHVRGVINLRGKIIPVADLRRRFGLPDMEATDSQRIVVVELGGRRIGMLVDRVSQVIKIPEGVVEEMPEEATTIDDNYIMGVGKLGNRLVIILDLNRPLLLL